MSAFVFLNAHEINMKNLRLALFKFTLRLPVALSESVHFALLWYLLYLFFIYCLTGSQNKRMYYTQSQSGTSDWGAAVDGISIILAAGRGQSF